MLIQELKDQGKGAEAKAIENIWKQEGPLELSVDECLALKVKLLMFDNQYIEEYKWLNEHHYPILKPLNQLKAALKKIPSWIC